MQVTDKTIRLIKVKEQISELLKRIENDSTEKINRALSCGAIGETDILSLNNATLAKVIIKNIADGLIPDNAKLKKEIKNLDLFI